MFDDIDWPTYTQQQMSPSLCRKPMNPCAWPYPVWCVRLLTVHCEQNAGLVVERRIPTLRCGIDATFQESVLGKLAKIFLSFFCTRLLERPAWKTQSVEFGTRSILASAEVD